MIIEIVSTFKKLSDGSILHPGDILDLPQEKAHILIEKSRARPLISKTNRNAPSCPNPGLIEATMPRNMSPPSRFYVGDSVQFAFLRASDVREGVILETKWHPTLTRTCWCLIEIDFKKIWISESHVIGRIKTRTSKGPSLST